MKPFLRMTVWRITIRQAGAVSARSVLPAALVTWTWFALAGCNSFSGGSGSGGGGEPTWGAEHAGAQNAEALARAEIQGMNEQLSGDPDAALVEEDIAALQEDTQLTAEERAQLLSLQNSHTR